MTKTTYLADCIRYHRKQSGLSRDELAKIAGVGKTVIYDIEHGKSTIQLDTLMKILHALNIQTKFESPLMNAFEDKRDETG